MVRETDLPDRDPLLDRAWRTHSGENPSPSLDRAILAAAHRAAGGGPRDATEQVRRLSVSARWWAPLAVAASLAVVVVGIIRQSPEDPVPPPPQAGRSASESMPPSITRAPASEQASDARVPATVAPSAPPRREAAAPAPPPAVRGPALQREGTRAAPAASPPAAEVARSPLAESNRSPAAEGARSSPADSNRSPAAEGARSSPAEGVASPAAVAGIAGASDVGKLAAPSRDPEAWIARIRALRDEDRVDEAARELEEFRRAYPDAGRRLPPDLREWRPGKR